jgi:hypothetical protein
MGSIIDLLALLDGWDYRIISGTVAVQPGVITEVFAENVKGWLIFAIYDSTDAYARIIIQMPPETFSIISANLTQIATQNVFLTTAQGIQTIYYNFPGLPADSSGAGIAAMNLEYPLPMKKDSVIHIQFTLDPGTTQPFAVVDYEVIWIQIQKPDVFIKSLRDIFKGNLANFL